MSKKFAPGTEVTCEYRADHTGVVLAVNDPRAWAGTYSFYGTSLDNPPSQEDVNRHLSRHAACSGCYVSERTPVLWSFGVVYWDSKLEAR